VNAVAELYQVPLDKFIAERKRLAKETGDKSLLERRKPSISAWVVNQLWWHARDAFDTMTETADKIRKGDVSADKAHREAIAKLRTRAAALLKDAGHGATESVLRRVTTTLSAIAAAGDWQGHEPGALPDDLDPPGFGAVGLHVPSTPKPPHRPKPPPPTKPVIDKAAEHKKKERAKLEARLAQAREHVEALEAPLEKARERVKELERALRDLQ
jgi:F0F1-type ATP synthase membrane subunit b/b'